MGNAAARFMDDPAWSSRYTEMPSGGPHCGLPAHEDCTPLDPDAVAAHLGPGGAFGAERGYETRPGQMDMARAVSRAFNDRAHLMIEAGTGVGKSLAYLVPAVQWSFTNDTPVVVSTATRNLQTQLTGSDIPRAARTLGDDASKLRTALLKGRSNYLCLRSLEEVIHDGYYALKADEKAAFDKIVPWLETTPDGDLDVADAGPLRARLSCTGDDCWGRHCPFFGKCFVRKARDRAQRAHVVVVNHALALAEASAPGSGLLPAYGRLIFDEAHDLDEIATDFFSFTFSAATFEQLMGRLERKSRRRRGPGVTRGLLGSIARQLEHGALADAAAAAEVRERLTAVHAAIGFARLGAAEALEAASVLMKPAEEDGGEGRLRFRAAPQRQYARNGLFADYNPAQWNENAWTAKLALFEDRLARVGDGLMALGAALETPGDGDGFDFFSDLAAGCASFAGELASYVQQVKFLFAASDPDHVYWAERTREGVAFTAAPLSVADEMRKSFFDVKDSVVLCSATLRAGDKFDYMARKLGFPAGKGDRARTLVAASPFDYFRQTTTLAADFLPDVAADPHAYAAALAEFLEGVFTRTHGRGLVLFTAYDLMEKTAECAGLPFATAGLRLLVQGGDMTREAMQEALRSAKEPTVLFGAQSFWEGVDVAGEALSCVVIARLPFQQAGDPITEARSEKIEAAGGSSFRDYMIPEAVIRFRQGFGRLVRTKTDRGVVIVTDVRLARKNYGGIFKKAVPAPVHLVRSADEVYSRVQEFFGASAS